MKKTLLIITLRGLGLAGAIACSDLAMAVDGGESKPKTAYFGELHLHTAWSLDAYGFGNQVVGPDEAYRFAQGEEVAIPGGGKTRITQPLDFASVVEHAEWLGEMRMILSPDHEKYNNPFARNARAGDENFFKTILAVEDEGRRPPDFSGKQGEFAAQTAGDVWRDIVEITERYNQPGTFTTLHGFEWTAAPDGSNLHRNLFFRSDKLPVLPVSWFEARTVEELWTWMETTGGGPERVLAIPHNANMSGGLMFKPAYSDGRPIDAEYARRRATNEPLFEIVQAKGASESSPQFAPNDEFINFELVGDVNFVGQVDPSPHNWVREALKNGMALKQKLGVNPFGFGIVAATDQHNGLMGDTDEFDFNGSHGLGDATPAARLNANMEVFDLRLLNPGGLTGVWAAANTREEIWNAMRRKETFGTSGVRIKVRLFGGGALTSGMASNVDLAALGYARGVPMGGVLDRLETAPGFLVQAIRDPQSGNLDRIQIVKGWLTADGEVYEKIYDVVWSGNRQLDKAGRLPAVGNTVDAARATFENSIGADQLSGFWRDPDFDPQQPAFYYARVLQIPTPRWSTYDAARADLALPNDVPAAIQERAWTSPIWYTP